MAKKHTHVSITRFRVILDTEADVFREVEIETDASLEELHLAVLDAFDFEAGEMASFYMSNEEWEKGDEIPLLAFHEGEGQTMANTNISDVVQAPFGKLLYVYDFMRMWIFYLEAVEVKQDKPSTIYPRVALVFGDAPDQYSKEAAEEFVMDDNMEEEFDDDLDEGEDEIFDEDDFNGEIRDHRDE
jgi:hypothetical protein